MAPDIWIRDACGVDRDGRAVGALVHRRAYDREGPPASILVIGDLTGGTPGQAVADALAEVVREMGNNSGSGPAISVVPTPRPAGNGAPVAPYPPVDGFFDHESDPVARYLWQWIGYLAPDLIVEIRGRDTAEWRATDRKTAEQFGAARVGVEDDSLLGAFGNGAGDTPGAIPGLRITAPHVELGAEIGRLIAIGIKSGIERSGARRSLVARRARSAADVVRILVGVYGYTLDPVVYTQGVSIGGRLAAWETGITQADPTGNIREFTESLLTDPSSFLDTGPDGAALAGLTWACDMARITGDEQAKNLFIAAADRFEDGGEPVPPPPADVDFRVEDMFFVATVIGQAYRLTGNNRYSLLLEGYMGSCLGSGVQTADGLFDHSQGARFPWGRGNGFAALGYAEALTYLSADSPVRSGLVDAHRTHLTALLAHAAPSGKQRQLTDFPGSYEELSATCMVGIALARGVGLGWLDESYLPGLKRCWSAASESINADGGLVDVCAGTGPQMSVREYLDRPAVSGLDDRGGAMAMWFALEMAKINSARE
jgi:unsaturated rhamnogalacturonyl hydrolase